MSKMDTEIKIKEEFPLSDNITSHHEELLFTECSAVVEDVAIKTEIKSETLSPVVKEYNSDNEREYILGTNEEHASCDEIKVEEDFPSEALTRSFTEEDDSRPMPSAGDIRNSASFCLENNYYESGYLKVVVTDTNSVQVTLHSVKSNGSCMQKNNNDKKVHKCEVCEKTFTLSSSLKRHYLIHAGKQPHKCQICDKRFSRLSYLKCHNLSHEGKRPFKCEICGKGFTRLSHLKYHNLMHEGKKPHKCETCDKSFSRLSHLKYHNLIHEGKKDYQCEICEKRFTGLSDLKKHNLFHEGKRVHKCNVCDKGFNRMSDLKRHILIHKGKKPYKCDVCEKSFTQMANFKRHYLIHERKKTCSCLI